MHTHSIVHSGSVWKMQPMSGYIYIVLLLLVLLPYLVLLFTLPQSALLAKQMLYTY